MKPIFFSQIVFWFGKFVVLLQMKSDIEENMAWNYRKRIKIAPGIHVNLSKGGVSTSVGPRGAKVTFGRNGTYMNTGIPGTGIYSRQKIGGGTGLSSYANKENNGGLGCFNIIISIAFLFAGIVCFFTKSPIAIFIGFALIGIAIVIFCKSIISLNNEDKSTEQPLTDANDTSDIEKPANSNTSQISFPIKTSTDEKKNFLGIYDPLLEDAVFLLIQNGIGSTSLIQRTFAIGYARAGRLMDQLEEIGVVGSIHGSSPRELLIHNTDEWLIMKSRLLVKLAKQITKGESVTSEEHAEEPSSHLIEEQFNLIKSASNNLCDFIIQIGRKRNVRAKLDEMLQIENNDGTPWSISKKVQIATIADVARCYKGLGHNFSLNDDEENIGIYLFLSKYIKPDVEITFDRRSHCRAMLKDSFVGILETSELLNRNSSMLSNEFFLQKALGECDRTLQTQYMSLLYRFASAVAKADGHVNETEEKWLSDIMKSNEIGNGSNIKHTTQQELDSVESPYSMLENLVGLSSVKDEITKLANFIKIQQVRKSKGLKTPELSYHCVFTGNPGTGKTTVARIMASIYKDLGILRKGHLVETDRSGLVAEYVGQTAVKTNKIIDSALDGVLFIDEAYSLVQSAKEDFGQEAISTLLKRMEDDRNRLVVILAGYGSEMKVFIDSNPGLQSRFNRYIHFPDYTKDELKKIFVSNASNNQYTLDNEAIVRLEKVMSNAVENKDKNFGNARFVRNLFEKSIQNQAMRLSSQSCITEDLLSTLKAEDIPNNEK